jgi:carbohydrate esterase-like sialic acid-specific acetylesterase
VQLRFPLAVLCVAVLCASFAAAESSGSSLPTPDEVFVLAGQSNMLGRGFPISAGAPSNPGLLVWRTKGWKIAADPLGNKKDSANGVSPGMTFGLGALADLAPETVGLVMCAVSGTTISKWEPPHSVYTNCINQVRAAGGHVDGILFLQGESDATNRTDASSWAKRFTVVLNGFRTDLGPDIPFVLGQIGKITASGFSYQKTVRAQQAKAASGHPGVAMITTLDLPTGSDGLHFTVDSYKAIGARFATAWWNLRQSFARLVSAAHSRGRTSAGRELPVRP